jgi:hypothetical protein
MLQVAVYRQPDGDPNAWDEMVEAMAGASGCLPDLIKLGYPSSEIKELERELRSRLPKSHPRIGSSMALITWYAIAVAQLADFDANSIKQYVINHLCPIANAADTNGDSIADFLDKLSALKSEALVGDWNCLLVEAKGEKALAVQMSQVFPLLDKHFNPVYSRKVLEALIAKAGGTLQSVQKFHSNRDESLAYYRAKITAEVEPKEPEYKPKRCVLIPFHLIKGFTDDWKEPPPSPPSSDGGGGNSPHNNSPGDNGGEGLVTSPVTAVTASYSQLHEKCNQQDVEPESLSAISDSPVTSIGGKSTKEKQIVEEAIVDALGQEQKSHTLFPEKNVTGENLEAEALIQTESERLHISCNQTVTGCNQETKDVTEGVSQANASAPFVEQTAPTFTDEAICVEEQRNALAPTSPIENAPEATPAVADESTFFEEVSVLAGVLASEAICPDRSELATIRQLYSPAVLNAACKRLSIERHAQIKQWVIELNEVQQAQKQKVGDNPLEVVGTSIQLNQRVRVHCLGSQRDKKTGVVVKRVDGQTVVVRLDDTKLRYDLQMWECNVSWLSIL